jgi:hypothetical protein
MKSNLIKSIKNMRALGMTPLKVDIDIGELLMWCAGRGFKTPEKSSRVHYRPFPSGPGKED